MRAGGSLPAPVERSAPDAMLLCALLRTALSVYLGGALQILIFLLQNSGFSGVRASLPPGAEDEIILIEHLPGRRVHLQDFFWTGPEDAPPWVDPNQGLTFYETRTVHHTVTVYSPREEEDTPIFPGRPGTYDPECTTCIEPTPRLDDDENQSVGVLIGEDPGPRYWLLTVLRPGEAVPPKVELRLARLYRAAFSRHQHRHLGLLTTDPRSRRATQEQNITGEKSDKSPSQKKTMISLARISEAVPQTELKSRTLAIPKPVRMVEVPLIKFRKQFLPSSDLDDGEEADNLTNDDDYFHPRNLKAPYPNTEHPISPEVNSDPSSNPGSPRDSTETIPTTSEAESASGGVRLKLRSLDRSVNEIVQVMMQNTSVTEAGATKLIYSVHLGGKPVPAETAARDMALLSPQEVALELGAPVIIQSEPFLKESRPLALSRKRDAWLLIGAAGAGVILLAIVLIGLIVAAKRKRAHSAVVAPPNRSILKKEREYVSTSPGLDNAAFSASETEVKTDGTSQRQTPGSLSRTPITPETPESLETGIHEVSSEDEEDSRGKSRRSSPWELQEQPQRSSRQAYGRISRRNAVDPPRTPDSLDSIAHMETLNSLENGFAKPEEATASPHSYLSMPSCKQFPSMRSVEPLSRVLEPVMVRHLDIESPELVRRDNGYAGFNGREKGRGKLVRTPSAIEDPGVVGPIVWSLRRHGIPVEVAAGGYWTKRPLAQSLDRPAYRSTGYGTSETDVEPGYLASGGPVGRARRRLHELLEDSFSLFGSRDTKTKEQQASGSRPTSATRVTDGVGVHSEARTGVSTISPLGTPTFEVKSRPRTSAARPRGFEEDIVETGTAQPRGAWGTRPLSAGPFHRPNLPEVDARRILTESRLPPEDPAVPLIASIKKELEKFNPQQ